MKKAMILTVGTGTRPEVDIVRPLVKTVKDSAPGYTLFVASEVSQKHAEKIAETLDLDPSEWSLRILTQFDDVEAVFLDVCNIIREVIRQGFSPEDIQVDFTSGTKAMSAGAVLAAVHENCDSLKYITGKRESGVVKDGTERFVSLCPHAVFANYEIKTALELIKKLRFQPAIDILNSIDPDLLGPQRKSFLDSLNAVAQAYDFWDRFDHIKFKGAMKKVDRGFDELAPFLVGRDIIDRVHEIGEVLKRHALSENVIVDLFNNAERRAMEGRYDDALARLYRLAEMLAQYLLWGGPYQINTSDVDISRIPLHMHEVLEVYRATSDENIIKIGLRKSYELLAALEEDVGKKYIADNKLKHLLNERNNTILAHGTNPVTADLYRKLKEQVVGLLEVGINDFEVKKQGLNFPWLS